MIKIFEYCIAGYNENRLKKQKTSNKTIKLLSNRASKLLYINIYTNK